MSNQTIIVCLEMGTSDGRYSDVKDAEMMLGWYRAAYPSYTFETFKPSPFHKCNGITRGFDFWVEDQEAADRYDAEN